MDNREKLTVVIGVKPLPGTLYGRDADMKDILGSIEREAKQLYDAGVRSIMIQNVNDLPAYDRARIETIAFMTACACTLKASVGEDCLTGISILRNDTPACIAVAKAAGLDWVRAKVYVGSMIRTIVEEGGCDDTLDMKARLNSDAEIWADVHDRMGVPLGNPSLLDACNLAIKARADKLIITGKSFNETVEMVTSVKAKFPKTKVIVGGGANSENIAKLLEIADGVVVATTLKKDGNINNELDPQRLKAFMDAFNSAVGR